MYGKTKGVPANLEHWGKHDHALNWNDGGQVRRVLDETQAALERIVAEETKAAVADYAANADVALGVSKDGQLLVGVRLFNQDSHVAIRVPFLRLVVDAINQAKTNIATDEGAQALLSAILSVGNNLANVGRAAPAARVAGERKAVAGSHQQHAIRSVPRRPERAAAVEDEGEDGI